MNEFNEQLNEFILKEIIPQYDDIQRFKMYNSKILGIELIFHVRFNMIKDELDDLKENIEFNLGNYFIDLGINPKFIVILSTF